MASYRRRRAAGEFADDPFGDVFLVVDGWNTLRQEYEELEQTITNARQPGPRLRRPRGAHGGALGGDPDQHAGPARHQAGAAPRRPGRVRDRPPGGANVPEQRARPRPDPRQAALPHRAVADRRSQRDIEDLSRGVGRAGRARGGQLAGPARHRRCGCCRAGCRSPSWPGSADRSRARPADRRQRVGARAGLPGPGARAAPDGLRRRRVRQDQPAAADRARHRASGTRRPRRGWSSPTTGAACWARSRATTCWTTRRPTRRSPRGSARSASALPQPAARPGRDHRPAARPELVAGPGAVHPGRRLRPGAPPAATTRSAPCTSCCRRPATSVCT